MNILIGLLIPFSGTVLGAAMVFFLKDKINEGFEKILLGFASGVMIAASVWSLLIPSLEMGGTWKPAAFGFLSGMGFLLLLDTLIPHLHIGSDKPEGMTSHLKRNAMLMLAVTLHNIPEGMAVGVVVAGALTANAEISLTGALALAIGIAIQNFPEGAIVSMPLRTTGASKGRAFTFGALSGAVEPLASLITILLLQYTLPILPFLLAFAAGAMIYVVVEELIPQSQQGNHSNWSTIGVALGFVLMMVLDVTLG